MSGQPSSRWKKNKNITTLDRPVTDSIEYLLSQFNTCVVDLANHWWRQRDITAAEDRESITGRRFRGWNQIERFYVFRGLFAALQSDVRGQRWASWRVCTSTQWTVCQGRQQMKQHPTIDLSIQMRIRVSIKPASNRPILQAYLHTRFPLRVLLIGYLPSLGRKTASRRHSAGHTSYAGCCVI